VKPGGPLRRVGLKPGPGPVRRKPLQPTGGQLRRSPFRRGPAAAEAKTQRDTGPPTAARRKVRARSGRLCELALPGCWGQATQACHRLGKKFGGRHGAMAVLINGPAWFLHGCGWCHRLTTSAEEPHLSRYRAAGLLLVEGQDARQVAVKVRWWPVKVRLDDDGLWSPEVGP
jgi:hypothetical protein